MPRHHPPSASAEAGALLDAVQALYAGGSTPNVGGLLSVAASPVFGKKPILLTTPRARARLLVLCDASETAHAAAAASLVASQGKANQVVLDGPVTIVTASPATESAASWAQLSSAAAAHATLALPPPALACPHADTAVVFYGAGAPASSEDGSTTVPAVTEGLVERLARGADVVAVLLSPSTLQAGTPAARAAAAAARGARRRSSASPPPDLRFVVVPSPASEAERHAALVSVTAGLAPLLHPSQLLGLQVGCGGAGNSTGGAPNALPAVGEAAAAAVPAVLRAALDALDRDCAALLAAAAGAEAADRRVAAWNRAAAVLAVPVAFAAYIARTLLLAFLVQTVLATRLGRAAAGWLPPAAERAALGLARSTKGAAPDAAALRELVISAAAAALAWGALTAAAAALRTPRPLMAKAAVEEVGRARAAAVAARARCAELGGAPAKSAVTGGAPARTTRTAGTAGTAAPARPASSGRQTGDGEGVTEGGGGRAAPPPPAPSLARAALLSAAGLVGNLARATAGRLAGLAAAPSSGPLPSDSAEGAGESVEVTAAGAGEPPPAARPTRSRRPAAAKATTAPAPAAADEDDSPGSYATAAPSGGARRPVLAPVQPPQQEEKPQPSPAGAKPVAHPLRRVAAARTATAGTAAGGRPGRAAAAAARAALARGTRGEEEEGSDEEEELGSGAEEDEEAGSDGDESPSPSGSSTLNPAASGPGGGGGGGGGGVSTGRPARSGPAVSRRSTRR